MSGKQMSHTDRSATGVAWWRILSWQMYDFADTIYSMNVYTMYFGIFIMLAFSVSAASFGWAVVGANLVVALISPLLGAMSDASQRRLPFLHVFVFGTVTATALIGFSPSFPMALTLYILSYVCYCTAWNFYQALLPGLCTEANVSKVSGIAIGLGYAGALFGLLSLKLLGIGDEQAHLVFPISAGLYLLFALPCLLFVPDFAPASRKVVLDIGDAYRRVAHTIKHARKYPGLFPFLVADFVYENAVAAVVSLMVVYTRVVFHFTAAETTNFMLVVLPVAVLFGLIFGPFVDWAGPKLAVLLTLMLWLVIFPLAATATSARSLYWIGGLTGVGLSAIWTASRTYLVALAPVQKSGEFFGLYSLSGKSAGILGNFAWTATLTLLTGRIGEGPALRMAIWVLWAFIIAGLVMVLFLPNVRPSKANVLDRTVSEQ